MVRNTFVNVDAGESTRRTFIRAVLLVDDEPQAARSPTRVTATVLRTFMMAPGPEGASL
jgi:hypothetical protein